MHLPQEICFGQGIRTARVGGLSITIRFVSMRFGIGLNGLENGLIADRSIWRALIEHKARGEGSRKTETRTGLCVNKKCIESYLDGSMVMAWQKMESKMQ